MQNTITLFGKLADAHVWVSLLIKIGYPLKYLVMKKMYKNPVWYMQMLMLAFSLSAGAQVKFGENKTTINSGSLLELESSTSPYKGVLFPRISIATTTTWGLNGAGGTVSAGMMMYNTNVSITSTNTSYPILTGGKGMYYWDGGGWVGMTTNGQYWNLKGNGGTNGTVNYLGTNDNQPLVFKVNKQLAGYIDSSIGSNNLFLGYLAGRNTVAAGGTSNVLMGYKTGWNNTGDDNIMLGDSAGASNTTGSDNLFMGFNAGLANTTGNVNIMMGSQAGNANVSGSNNIFMGLQSGFNTTASDNSFIGNGSGSANTTGTRNSFIGLNSGHFSTTGSNNYFSGYYAGYTNTTGSNNVAIGVHADFSSGTLTRAAAIGYNAVVSTSGSMVLGGTGADGVNVGIGTTAPLELFQVGDPSSTYTNSPVILLQSSSNTSGKGGILRFRRQGYTASNYGMDIRHSTGSAGSTNEGLYFDRVVAGVTTNAAFIDAGTGWLGVGTASPQQNVHISGTSTSSAIGTTGANLVTPTLRVDGLNATNNAAVHGTDPEPKAVYATTNGDLVLISSDSILISNENFIADASPVVVTYAPSGTGLNNGVAQLYTGNFTLSRRALVSFSYSVSLIVTDYGGVVLSDGYVRLMQTWMNIINTITSTSVKATVGNASTNYVNSNTVGSQAYGYMYNNGQFTTELPAGSYRLEVWGNGYSGGGKGIKVSYGGVPLDEVQIIAHYK